jgi:hypothetical protein
LTDHERFALPLAEAVAVGGGDLASTGTFRSIEGDAMLSSIRRVGGSLQVRVWNPRSDGDTVVAIDGEAHRLGPARIETLEVNG